MGEHMQSSIQKCINNDFFSGNMISQKYGHIGPTARGSISPLFAVIIRRHLPLSLLLMVAIRRYSPLFAAITVWFKLPRMAI